MKTFSKILVAVLAVGLLAGPLASSVRASNPVDPNSEKVTRLIAGLEFVGGAFFPKGWGLDWIWDLPEEPNPEPPPPPCEDDTTPKP